MVSSPTLPDDQHPPPKLPESFLCLSISFDVAGKFPPPEVDPGLRYVGVLAPGVTVPEASVDKYHRPVLRKHNIRATGEVSAMNPEAETHAVKKGAHDELRSRVPASDPRHVPASPLFGKSVHFSQLSQLRQAPSR